MFEFLFNSKYFLKTQTKCGQQEITASISSNESHLSWKKDLHKKSLYFKFYADFEADNEIHFSCIGNEISNILKQNPVFNGFRSQ